jgi:hypothetical protein
MVNNKGELFIYRYRNPIPGTLSYPYSLALSPSKSVEVQRYSVDSVANRLWFYIAPNSPGLPPTKSLSDPSVPWFGWVMVASRNTGGVVAHPETGQNILVPPSGSNDLFLSKDDILACLRNLSMPAEVKAIADLNAAAWGMVSNFTFLPVSVGQVCSVNQPSHIWGFGYYIKPSQNEGTETPYDSTGGYHMGVDIFVPIGSNVYSIRDNGIVVGIGQSTPSGIDGRYSQGNWGAVAIASASTNNHGYNLLIRYGPYIALFGHLMEVNPEIYVGKAISEGEILGKIGKAYQDPSALPHLHLEVRSVAKTDFYQKIWDQPFQGSPNNPNEFNKFGIFQIGAPGNPSDFYDIFQTFNAQISAFETDASSTKTIAYGLGLGLKSSDKVYFGVNTCNKTYRGAEYTGATVPKDINGLRGFRSRGNMAAAPFPINGTPPSIYPTLTPSPVFFIPVQQP